VSNGKTRKCSKQIFQVGQQLEQQKKNKESKEKGRSREKGKEKKRNRVDLGFSFCVIVFPFFFSAGVFFKRNRKEQSTRKKFQIR